MIQMGPPGVDVSPITQTASGSGAKLRRAIARDMHGIGQQRSRRNRSFAPITLIAHTLTAAHRLLTGSAFRGLHDGHTGAPRTREGPNRSVVELAAPARFLRAPYTLGAAPGLLV